jgi:subtilisin family serine protease
MDAAGLAALISPNWFTAVADVSSLEHAGAATWTAQDTIEHAVVDSTANTNNLYDWIVQFDTASVAGIHSVAETSSLLVGGGIDFQVISGLGIAGQVLVRSSGASVDAVEGWLTNNVNVDSFEEDAVRQYDVVSTQAATSSNDPLAGNLWGMRKIDAQEAWSISTGSNNVVVAVIDTGVDYTHSDLAANVWTNTREIAGNGIDDDSDGFVDDVHGYNFINNTGDPMDDNGHGTHVSGTIAAVGDNGLGVAGLNWSTSIMGLKFLNNNGEGYLSDAIRAINYATMERTVYGVNVRVMNNSWGGGSFSSAMQNAIQAAGDAGIMFVAAAGNSGTNNDTSPQYPANYAPANVVSVAASTQSDQLAYFSCYGATTVDVAAPGVSIYSTLPGNRYGSYSGTSMATPHVAALAALAWAVDPTASVAEIRSAILDGADHVAALNGLVATGGRLNAYNTLTLLGSTPTPSQPVPTPTPTPSQPAPTPTPTPSQPEPTPPTPIDTPPSSLVGVYNASTSTFYLNSTGGTGNAGAVFTFNPAQGNGVAIDGDWNADGQDSIGMYDAATSRFYLKNSNDSGNADMAFVYGPAGSGWIPVSGDWNGDGMDTIGLYNPATSTFYLKNSNAAGFADITFTYGPGGQHWTPIVGDWNGDGVDTIGLYNPKSSTFYLRNSNSNGFADTTFVYGPANGGWTPIVGDWTGNTGDTIGLYNPAKSVFYLRNSNTSGYADSSFAFGSAGSNSMPLVGEWFGSGSSAKSVAQESIASLSVDNDLGRLYLVGLQTANSIGLDRIAEAVPDSLRNNLFGELASDHVGPFDRDDLLDGLQDHLSSLLGEPVGTVLADNMPTDVSDTLHNTLEGISTDHLILDSVIEQNVLDQIYDMLGELRA